MTSSEYYIADNSNIEDKKLEAAKNHYNTGDYNSALRLYLSLINTSISYRLYHRIAKCYYKLGEIDKAKEFFQKSVNLEPKENPSYQYLGNIYFKNNDLKNAIYNWLHVYSYKPNDETITRNLATSYYSLGMNFQSVFYYKKYLKYASDKSDEYYEIKNSIEKCNHIASESVQKAKNELSKKNYNTAIEYLTFAVKNAPLNFEVNTLLGNLYLNLNDNMHALAFYKQAFCIENSSLEVMQKLTSIYINLGDYTAAFCIMRRLLPLVVHNQQEYLKTLNMIKNLGNSFDGMSYQGHKKWGDTYYDENNYHLALIEYENCIILNEEMKNELNDRIEEIKMFINPEQNIIKECIGKGNKLLLEGKNTNANKYFTKVLQLSERGSGEYKLAKSKIV